jgi:hypothetical protein
MPPNARHINVAEAHATKTAEKSAADAARLARFERDAAPRLYTPPAPRDVPAEAVIKSMNVLGRLAEPDEIASVAVFFAVTGRFVHHRRHHRHRRGMDLNAPNSERRVQRREDEPQC